VSAFFSVFQPIVMFDFLPTDLVYPLILKLPVDDQPLSKNFDAIGYFSSFSMNNLGSMGVFIVVGVPLLLLIRLLAALTKNRTGRV
jgi:hypothetical protein